MSTVRDIFLNNKILTPKEAQNKLIENFYHHVRNTLENEILKARVKNENVVTYDISHLVTPNHGIVQQELPKHSYFKAIVKDAEKAGVRVVFGTKISSIKEFHLKFYLS